MPVRTYTGLDLANYIASYTPNFSSPFGTCSSSILGLTPSQGAASIAGPITCNNTLLDHLLSSYQLLDIITISGDFDFNAFPSIPSNALITRVRYKIDASVSIVASAEGNGDSLDVLSFIIAGIAMYRDVTANPANFLSEIFVGGTDSFNEVTGAHVATVTDSDTYTRVTEFDFTGSPIDKTTFEAAFANLFIVLGGADSAGGVLNTIIAAEAFTGIASADVAIEIVNFQMIVEYESGPELTLNPSGGPVEPGQTVVVTGPGAGTTTYAGTADPKVIPIVPKVVGPNEVEIPVPLPPTDDCVGCLTACPECDDCFDACTNDLLSEACQDCLDACLDCLVECLENLELGEACQQSTQTPPEIPVVIICGTPTRFAGSVPLGNFTVIVARASGIYRFIPGKTNDTLYATARDGTTYDVAIPIPFVKTGFFRS